MKNFKSLAVLALSAAMITGMTITANASSLDDPIDSVSIDISYELSSSMSKSDIDVSSDTDGVDSVTVSSVSNVSYGKQPTVTLKVKADTSSGYYFDSDDSSTLRSESAWSLSGDDAEYKSSKRSSNSYCELTVKLPKIGEDGDGLSVSNVSWDGDSGVVSWDSADDATKYSVKLLKGSSTKATVTTTDTSYNFASQIKSSGTGTYSVKVKAYNGNHSGDWEDSDEFDVTSGNINSMSGSYSSGSSSSGSSNGSWMQNGTGWWYCNADRSYPQNCWQQIDGCWYHFDSNGYMQTGWFQSPESGKWYYLSTDSATLGRMLTNTTVDGYYINSDGVWVQ